MPDNTHPRYEVVNAHFLNHIRSAGGIITKANLLPRHTHISLGERIESEFALQDGSTYKMILIPTNSMAMEENQCNK